MLLTLWNSPSRPYYYCYHLWFYIPHALHSISDFHRLQDIRLAAQSKTDFCSQRCVPCAIWHTTTCAMCHLAHNTIPSAVYSPIFNKSKRVDAAICWYGVGTRPKRLYSLTARAILTAERHYFDSRIEATVVWNLQSYSERILEISVRFTNISVNLIEINPALVPWGSMWPQSSLTRVLFWNCHEYWHILSRIFA